MIPDRINRRNKILDILNRRERSIRRISEACSELYDAKKAKGPDVVWVPKLGPCTAWERDLARQLVAQRITYDAAMGAWFPGVTP